LEQRDVPAVDLQGDVKQVAERGSAPIAKSAKFALQAQAAAPETLNS